MQEQIGVSRTYAQHHKHPQLQLRVVRAHATGMQGRCTDDHPVHCYCYSIAAYHRRVEDGRPSATALTAAAMRAHHYYLAQQPRVLNDPLAMQLAGMTSPTEVCAYIDRMVERLARFGDRDAAEAVVRDATMCVCARSRIVEDELAASLARGMKQLIILGAGLDSTAYRCPDVAAGLEIFEVDHPATQAWKRERLAAIGVTIPRNLTFVPFDFERQTMAGALTAGGVRADQMAFFTWLGVQPYLTDEAVMSTLDVVASFPPGSELALDLMTPTDARQSEGMTEGMRQMLEVVAMSGEPFKSTYAPEVFSAHLRQRGFTHIDMILFHDWFVRHGARFQGRFSTNVGPCIQITAQVE
jgi:methyltransferase (TIGR00027 family)